MNLSDDVVAEAIARQVLGDPELRAEWMSVQGGGVYLPVGDVAKKLKCSVSKVRNLGLPTYMLPGEKGTRWFEPEVDAWMQNERRVNSE